MAKNDVTKSKKTDDKSKTKDAKKKKGGIRKYFRELKAEMKKVVWPTRKEVFNNTGVVMGVMIIVALFLFGVDTGLGAVITKILEIGS